MKNNLTDIIMLAQAGVKATDIITLKKQGYTMDNIKELLLEENPEEDPKPKEGSEPNDNSDTPNENQNPNPKDENPKEDNPALIELEKLKKELAEEKEKVARLQKENINKDLSDEEPDDPTKSLIEKFSLNM